MRKEIKHAVVIGQGSIGRRHRSVLEGLGHRVWAVSRRPLEDPMIYSSLTQVLAETRPDYVVIASATHEHLDDLQALAQLGFAGQVLVEKPLFSDAADLQAVPYGKFASAHVAYNLRFHPSLLRLKALLDGQNICCLQAYVGQYLPQWRPGTDYRESYSAHADKGGGVLRDLSHELDYVLWILGGWTRMAALGGHVSALDITSDDVFAILMQTPRCPIVSVQMNYLDRKGRREITVTTQNDTYRLDLVSNTLWENEQRIDLPALDRDVTYRFMHENILTGGSHMACTLQEGVAVVDAMTAAERATQTTRWIER